jgi:hypothetical protein
MRLVQLGGNVHCRSLQNTQQFVCSYQRCLAFVIFSRVTPTNYIRNIDDANWAFASCEHKFLSVAAI